MHTCMSALLHACVVAQTIISALFLCSTRIAKVILSGYYHATFAEAINKNHDAVALA